jgi:hypothetical protein
MTANTNQAPGTAATPLAVLAIVLMAAYRLAPHPWNVAPAGALFLLGGLYLGRSWRGWAVPFAALIASDALIYLQWNGSLWQPSRLIDYAAFALVGLLGRAAAGRPAGWRIAGVAAAPVIFYLVSNFGVWLFGHGLYAHTPQGLADCYVAGLPFFRGTLLGDWLFAGLGILAVDGLPRLHLRSGHKAPMQAGR